MRVNRRRYIFAWAAAAALTLSSLLMLSFAFRPTVNTAASRGSSVETAYALFDSIRTDINDYIWPISARPKITSSFAEFRSSHFHAGLDIGTGNRTGADVYAARDGYVARVELSPYGYGRYLILRHPDGFYTTYAHLSAYSDELERAVRAEQLKQGKFSIEMKFRPGDFPVRKGDVVAFSGESGSGDPHLHFEIRDEHFNPVNPLLFPNIRNYRDSEPPEFRRLAILPMNENSYVDYEFAPKIYRARYRTRASYYIPDVIRGTGSVGFSIDAVDRVNSTRYSSSVYSFELQVDGATVFTSRRDRFPEEETRQVGLDFEWALWKDHKGRFQKLYVEEGNTLPFYNRRGEFDGVVAMNNFSEGMHRFSIIASDYSGNSSELTGSFVLNHPPKVEIVSETNELLKAFIPNSNNVAALEVGTRLFSSRSWHVQEFSVHELAFTEDTVSLLVHEKSADVIRVVARNKWGTHSFPVYYFLREPAAAGRPTISTEADGSFLKVRVESKAPFTAAPSLQIMQGAVVTSVALRATDLNEYMGIYRLSESYGGTSYVKAFCEVAGKRLEVFDSFTMNTVSPSQGGIIQSDDGALVLNFGPRAVFAPLHPIVDQLGTMRYDVYPRDVLLRGAARVTFKYPAEKEADDKLGMYVNSGGGWRFLETERNSELHMLTLSEGYSLGTFAILDDSQRPAITRWRSSSINMKRRPMFSFSVRDNLSGIDDDRVVMSLNGERIIPEYDPEKKTMFYVPLDPLLRGRYTVQAEVRDRAGNTARLVKSFSVYR